MSVGVHWQDLIAALAALLAACWLFRRWILKRRARAGCDTCAASFLKTQARRPGGTNTEGSPR
jgi:flagellar biogenesis protein FliO